MSQGEKTVMTVLGPVPATELGLTLSHEHVLIDITCYWQPPVEATLRALAGAPVGISNLGLLRRNAVLIRDNCLLTDLDAAIEEITEFRKLGGGTIIDVTLPDIGRDPVALQIASRMSGLHIVVGCGHYVYLAHPESLKEEPVESVAERLIKEIKEGIDSTGVRPGIIGEIGTSDPLRPTEEKALRAAARTQKATGLAITLHLYPAARKGHQILDILEEEGADPTRVVMGHLDVSLAHLDIDFDDAIAYHRSLAERGCYIEYDTCGNELCYPGAGPVGAFWCPSDRERAKGVAKLADLGFAHQILLSQDVCQKAHLLRYGGFGYGHVLRTFVRNLRDFGLGDADMHQMLVENPRRMLVGS